MSQYRLDYLPISVVSCCFYTKAVLTGTTFWMNIFHHNLNNVRSISVSDESCRPNRIFRKQSEEKTQINLKTISDNFENYLPGTVLSRLFSISAGD